MNNDTPSAVALARWLEEHPGTPPPEELDLEVMQAVYALRPELAPAPRLSADDILASVTRGPLADPRVSVDSASAEAAGAEVVPFPQRVQPVGSEAQPQEDAGSETRSSRQGRFTRWLGGSGGIGMALVAAATILLVATPILKSNESPEQAPVLSPAARQETSPAASAPAEVAKAAEGEGDVAFEAKGSALSRTPAPEVVTGLGDRGQGVSDEAIPMDGRSVRMDRELIPELQEQLAAPQGVASADSVSAGAQDALAQDVAGAEVGEVDGVSDMELDSLRAKASRNRGTAWRKDVPPELLTQVDQAIKEADALHKAGNPQAAGDKLKPFVKAPARMGQAVAVLAGEHYLAAGNADAAVGVAEMGIGLSTAGSPERSQLQVVYGDGLRQLGSRSMAADAYRLAK